MWDKPYDPPAAHTERSLTIWFGPAHPPRPRLLEFAEELREAVRNASLVGIPRVSRQQKGALVSYVRPVFENQRLHAAHTLYADCGAHNFFQYMHALDPWLRGREFLGLITCRELAAPVAETFQVKTVRWHRIPADFLTSQTVARPAHFPEVYEQLRAEIRPPSRGALYLVGAGVFGKVYCEWIRRRGGIAIDIGSVFDGWANVRVRDRLERRREIHTLERYRMPLERSARIAAFRELIRLYWSDSVPGEEFEFLLAERNSPAVRRLPAA